MPSATHINPHSKDDIDHFITVIVDSFSSVALTTAFIVNNDSTPPPYPSPLIDSSRRQRHFAQGIIDSAESGAELVQAGNWSAVALWEGPTYQGKPFIESKARPGPLLAEWRGKVMEAKKKYLSAPSSPTDASQIRPFYHLSFLARNPSAPKVSGSIAAVIEPFLQRARDEGVPAWLEATTRQAATVYEHFGFRLVEEITIGVGSIDCQGWPKEDGEGVTAYAMIYDQ